MLVVGPSWVGDMVMAQSLFMALRHQHPDASIDVLAPGWSKPILARMPEVADAIEMPVGHGQIGWRIRSRLGCSLQERHYDQAIVLPNSLKSALVPFWAKIPKRTGFRGEFRYGLLNDLRRLDKQRLPMTVQRFVALAHAPDCALPPHIDPPQLQSSATGVQAALERLLLPQSGQPILALCPGAAYGPAKQWPVEHFARVAKTVLAKGWQVWLFGSQQDHATAEQIRQQAGAECVNLAGRTELAEVIDLLSIVTVVVSNDSGLMHVAAALDRAVIALYGSSDPGFTPPLNDRAQILSLGLECSPCFQRTCPKGHYRCLNDLLPEQVIERLPIDSEVH